MPLLSKVKIYVVNIYAAILSNATGWARLIRTWLIRSSTLFEVSVKCFPIIFLSFHVKNALVIRSST